MECKKYKVWMQEILRHYYRVTAGGFFAAEQKKRLLELFARIEDIESDTRVCLQLLKTVEQVETMQVKTSLDCANWRFLNRFCGKSDDRLISLAICGLQEALEGCVRYTSVEEWYRALQSGSDQTLFVSAMLDYCGGEREAAIKKLKSLKKQQELYAIECLAQIALEAELYEDAYDALLIAKRLRTKLCQPEKCWIEVAIGHLEGCVLSKPQIKVLRAAALCNGQKQPIGFVSQC